MRVKSSWARYTLSLCSLSAALLILPVAASARGDYHHNHGRNFDRGSVFYYPYGWGWGGWGWGGPYWGPGYYYQENVGTVKLENVAKTDQVYINGSYAGPAKKLKSMYLKPGSYTVEIKSADGRTVVNTHVYVVRNKTVKLAVNDEPGKIKLKNTAEGDQVYLNGVYQGNAKDNDCLKLKPGHYQVVVMNNGREIFKRNVFLPSDKTVDLHINESS